MSLTWLTRSANRLYPDLPSFSTIIQSKRHSRHLSNSISHLLPNQSPPPISRPSSSNGVLLQPPKLHLGGETDLNDALDLVSAPRNSKSQPSPSYSTDHSLPSSSSIPEPSPSTPSSLDNAGMLDLTGSPRPPSTKNSTFRRLPRQKARRSSRTLGDQVLTHSHDSSVSLHPRSDKGSNETASTPVVVLPEPSPSVEPVSLPSVKVHITANNQAPSSNSHHHHATPTPAPISKSSSMNSNSNWDVSFKPLLPSSPASRKPAPYPPGFQPRGAYRVLTDDFLAARRMKHEGEAEGGMKRVERTKLERRLEKLINLHFPQPISEAARDGSLDEQKQIHPSISGLENFKASSIFDFQSLKNVNFNDASGLWRGVVNSGLRETTKMDVRGWHIF